jgi:galactonate dehydratase
VSERRMTRFAYREILQKQAAHIIMLDVVWTGGITEAIKIATLADTYHLAITPHDCTGPINVFAALHLCAAVQNVMIQETVRGFYEGYYLDLLTRPLPIREGRATFDLGPGLGVKLRPDLLSRPDLRRRASDV